MNDDAQEHSREDTAAFDPDEGPAHRWSEPRRSKRKRSFPDKPRVAGRPILVEPNDRRELLGESGLEGKAALVLLARPDCARLQEQPEPVGYLDYEGRARRHTFDFLMTLWSGARIAVAVKPFRIVAKHSLKGLFEHIARQMDPEFASGVLLLTDASMPPYAVQNGRLILDARRLPDRDADGRVRESVAALEEATTIDGLLRAAGLEGHDQGFYAAARAIGQGLLVPTLRGLIDRNTPIRRATSFGSAA